MEDSERRRFAVLGAETHPDWVDAAQEDGRRVLIESEHPELYAALESGISEVVVHGQVVNAALHVSLHEVVATQLWNDDPPEVWLTAVRLTSLGYDRHEVLHMLMTVVGEDVRRALADEPTRDPAALTSAYAELPESWERLRPAPPTNRAARRATARPR